MNICAAKCLVHYENLWTFELTYPRYIHSEFMTHRVFSRNASSSRAIPVKRMIEQVRENTVIPPKVFMNQKGMVGETEADPFTTTAFHVLWEEAAENACKTAEMMERLGIHKQHVNRILEPFQFIKVIVTATDWYNFFVLRLAPDAQPEIRELASAIYDEMNRYHNKDVGVLELDKEHIVVSLPYITDEDIKEIGKEEYHLLMKISAARCARVSYNNHDGSKPDIEKDLKLYGHLYDSKHMSPMEHACIRDEDHRKNANLTGWKSLRYLIETYEDL
jgi:thymidylate synthase ThyX